MCSSDAMEVFQSRGSTVIARQEINGSVAIHRVLQFICIALIILRIELNALLYRSLFVI